VQDLSHSQQNHGHADKRPVHRRNSQSLPCKQIWSVKEQTDLVDDSTQQQVPADEVPSI
jgi:hypothetical protein